MVTDYPLLTIVNDDTSNLTIVNIIGHNIFFKNDLFFNKQSFFKKQSYKKRSQIVLIKRSFSKTIAIRFLKVENDWVVYKNDRFFENETKNERLTIVYKKRLTTYRCPSDIAIFARRFIWNYAYSSFKKSQFWQKKNRFLINTN